MNSCFPYTWYPQDLHHRARKELLDVVTLEDEEADGDKFRPAVVCGNRSPIHNSNHEARSLGEVGVEEIIVAAHPAPAHPGIFQANTLIILGFQYSGF
ncbi:hypothetical protein OsI_23790 [Oryza sativa Indica Group]|uniref:Uncharacterized protein n=1 Tax=Oryza sativa subsp. indica TaxID=39946 RepID=A2YFA0_ORYSI|nr:hypothetical protein OsI_23790 [Oryza sativa Indica Group]